MKRLVLMFAIAGMPVLPALASAATWNIDTVHSSLGFKVRHFFSKTPGTFTDWKGTIAFDPENPTAAVIDVTIAAASIDTQNEKRDNHLRGEDFFWTENHPQLAFKSTRVEESGDGYLVHGLLTMRGVEKPVVLQAQFLGSGPDGWGGTRAGFTATTTVDRKEWGINWNKALDHGGAVLGDDVEITLDVEAVRAPEQTE